MSAAAPNPAYATLARHLAGLPDRVDQPRHAQLRRALEAWMSTRPAGDRLPPERWLADCAKVNRRTMRRALTDLVADGRLQRGQRGTVIATPPDPAGQPRPPRAPLSTAATSPHPLFALGYQVQGPCQTLTMAVYEHLPQQQRFWTAALAAVARQVPQVRVQLCWVPDSVASAAAYVDFIRQTRCDLVVHTGGMIAQLQAAELLAPLSATLCGDLRSAAYLWATEEQDASPLLPWAVPVHQSLTLVLWNRDLLGLPATAPLPATAAGIVDWLLAHPPPRRWPAGTQLLTNPLALLLAQGQPTLPMTPAVFITWVRRSALLLQRLGRRRAQIAWDPTDFLTQHQPFAARQSAVYVGPSPLVLAALADAPFAWTATLPEPVAGGWLDTHQTSVSLTRSAPPGPGGEALLRALLGPAVQQQVATLPLNCPLRRDALPAFATSLHAPAPFPAAALARLRRLPDSQADWEFFVRFGFAPQLQQVFAGSRAVDAHLLAEAQEIARSVHFPHLLTPAT